MITRSLLLLAACSCLAWANEPSLVPAQLNTNQQLTDNTELQIVDDTTSPPASTDAVTLGETVYGKVCATCHQPDGKGNIAFPPLEGSEWLKLDITSLARMQIGGLMGPITVAGKEYNGAMPPNSALSDEEMAAALQFVRTKWGGDSTPVDPSVIAQVRAENNVGMWTVETLMAKAPPESVTRIAMARGEVSDQPDIEEKKYLGMSREKNYHTDLLLTLLVMSGLFFLGGMLMARS